MKATVEPLEGNKVKLSIEVDEQEFEKAVNEAFRKIAHEVRIPGFRPGKAPRRILEARLGPEAARAQALHDAIPDYYAQAVREHDVDVIAAPDIDITDEATDGGPVAFDAVVEIRPRIEVPGYASLRVEIPSPEPSSEEIDAQIERMRNQFAELETVEREAADGDYVTLDIEGSQDGEELDGLTADDYSYEVGAGVIVPELDAALQGAKAGDTLEFDAAHPTDEDAELHFEVAVKDVKARILPELDDEFANEASEFDTLGELRADLEKRMSAVKKVQAQMALREKTAEALAGLVDEEISEALVNAEMQERLQDLAIRLQAQGLSLEQWMGGTGQSQEQVVEQLKETALEAVKVDLALRAVVAAQAIEATDEDLDVEFVTVAERMKLDPDRVRRDFERADQMPAIRSDITKRKALDWLVDTVEIVDEEGQPIDRAHLELDESPVPGDASEADTDRDAEGSDAPTGEVAPAEAATEEDAE